jgi:hypothetical protein
MMTCPTPELDIPDAFKGRRRRSTHPQDLHLSHDHTRQRRQATTEVPNVITNDTLTFYLGFILDGVESYRNMSLSNPNLGIIRVYKNPEFEMFTEEGHIKAYRKYWPINDNGIMIVVS